MMAYAQRGVGWWLALWVLAGGCSVDDSEGSTDDVGEDTGGPVVCGDGRAEGAEVCDGGDLNGLTCVSLGYDGGDLACGSGCDVYEPGGCTSECTPDCTGRICGPDPACAITCGFCNEGSCNAAGQCEGDECVPDCTGRECGLDPTCGGPCGTCDDGNCDVDGICQTGGSGPEILEFATNVDQLTQGESVVVTALVTDPDGVGDLVGGSLGTPDGDVYGTFESSGGGSYSLTLSWAAINQVEPIEFTNETARGFVARFFDVDGASAVESMTLRLHCDGLGSCDGTCTDLTTEDNCRSCGNSCSDTPGAICRTSGCGCPVGLGECEGACIAFDTVANCGGCGEQCDYVDLTGSGDLDYVQSCEEETCVGPTLSACSDPAVLDTCDAICQGEGGACDDEACAVGAVFTFANAEDCDAATLDSLDTYTCAESLTNLAEGIRVRCCCAAAVE